MEASSVTILDLPNEILIQIFSHLTVKNILSAVIDVCRRWKCIIESDILFWKHVHVTIDCDKFLNSTFLSDTKDATVSENAEDCNVYVGESDLEKIINLRNIKLENGNKPDLQNGSTRPALLLIRILDVLSRTCKYIEKVECSNCFGATSGHFLQFLNQRYNNITEIKFGLNCIWTIPYVELISFKSLTTVISLDYRFKSYDLFCLVEGCSQLNRLWILFSRAIKNDDVVSMLKKKKDSLIEVGLGLSVSDIVLNSVTQCSKLEVLFLSDSRYISDVGIRNLSTMSSLKYVSLHRAKVQPESLIMWLSSSSFASQLTVLDLTDYKFKDVPMVKKILQDVRVTFSNSINKALHCSLNSCTKPKSHWMYSNV